MLVLTRQKLPVLDRTTLAPAALAAKGGYVLLDAPGGVQPAAIVIATGSEVHVALTAVEQLQREGIGARLVSLPSWEIFDAQTPEYRESVLPAAVRARVAIEAAATFGWHRWVGETGASWASITSAPRLRRIDCSRSSDSRRRRSSRR